MFNTTTGKLECDVPGCGCSCCVPRVLEGEALEAQGEEMDQAGSLFHDAMVYAYSQGWNVQGGTVICPDHQYEVSCPCKHGSVQCDQSIVIYATSDQELEFKLFVAGWRKMPDGNWACPYYVPPRATNVSLLRSPNN